jgi:hypothetical protein
MKQRNKFSLFCGIMYIHKSVAGDSSGLTVPRNRQSMKEEEEKKFGSKFCEFRNIAADISFHRASAAS